MNDYTGKGNALFVILNVTHICNLSCKYCYYESKMQDKACEMSLGLIRRVFERATESSFQEVQFCFHCGEPMTLGRE